jgi:hypothetical protein
VGASCESGVRPSSRTGVWAHALGPSAGSLLGGDAWLVGMGPLSPSFGIGLFWDFGGFGNRDFWAFLGRIRHSKQGMGVEYAAEVMLVLPLSAARTSRRELNNPTTAQPREAAMPQSVGSSLVRQRWWYRRCRPRPRLVRAVCWIRVRAVFDPWHSGWWLSALLALPPWSASLRVGAAHSLGWCGAAAHPGF